MRVEDSGRQMLPAVAGEVLELARRVLGEELVAAYVYGSAVAGGLRPNSDLDILVVASRPTRQRARRRLVADLMDLSGPEAKRGPARPLEVTVVVLGDVNPWRYPPRCDLQYGEWLRDECTSGEIPPPRHDPDLTVLLHSAMQRSVVLAGPPAARLFDPRLSDDLDRAIVDLLPEVAGGWRGDERNALLTLARMWVTLASGDIVPKDAAAERVIGELPDRLRPVLQLAAAEYRGERQVDWEAQADGVQAFVAYAAAGITALGQDRPPGGDDHPE